MIHIYNLPYKMWEKIPNWDDKYKYYSEDQLKNIFKNSKYHRIDPFSGQALITMNPNSKETVEYNKIINNNGKYYIYYELDPDYWVFSF